MSNTNAMFAQIQLAEKGKLNTIAIESGRKDIETAKFCNDPLQVAETMQAKYKDLIDVLTEGKGIAMPCSQKVLNELVTVKGRFGIEDISRALLFTQCSDEMRVKAGFKSSRDKSAKGVYKDLSRGIDHKGSGKKLGLVCVHNPENHLNIPVAIGLTCKQVASIPAHIKEDFVKLAAFCKGLKEEVSIPSPSTDKTRKQRLKGKHLKRHN